MMWIYQQFFTSTTTISPIVKKRSVLIPCIKNIQQRRKNSFKRMYLFRFLSEEFLNDIITKKLLPKEVIKRAEEEKNFTKEISPSQYKNLSKREEKGYMHQR